MTTFKEDEESIEDSQPREGLEFILPAVTYRLASGVKDLVISGQTFRATTIDRAEAPVSALTNNADIEVSVIVSHALPQRYLRGGIPPRNIVVNIRRQQLRSGATELVWSGTVTSMSIERHVAKFLVSSRAHEALQRRIPTITVGRECAHVLYDTRCGVIRNSYRVNTTATTVNGRAIGVSSMGGHPDGWAKYGEIVHVASGERMTVTSQIGTNLEIQLPLVDMKSGDAVEIYAGCDHLIATCYSKFANQHNFGGFPQLPRANPFIVGGIGILAT